MYRLCEKRCVRKTVLLLKYAFIPQNRKTASYNWLFFLYPSSYCVNSVEVKLTFDLRSEFKTRLSKIAETVLTTIPLERKICAQLGKLTKGYLS